VRKATLSHGYVRKRRIEALIADATDEDLADLKSMVLGRVGEKTRAALKDKRVRENGWLQALIYEACCPNDVEQKK
jgi:hypothetical protein